MYDAITSASGHASRADDVAIRVRRWNNAVKAQVLDLAAGRLVKGRAAAAAAKGGGHAVLELACGKLGDLAKWKRHRVAAYTGVDISVESVAEASRRAAGWLPPHGAALVVADLGELTGGMWKPAHPATLVSMQFAVAYFAESMASLEGVFALAARSSLPGAAFALTYPSWDAVSAVLPSLEPGAAWSTGDGLCSIRLTDPAARRYVFSLGDNCVEDCPEFGVRTVELEAAAARHGWRLAFAVDRLCDVTPTPAFAAMKAEALRGVEAQVAGLYSAAVFVLG